MPEPTDFTAARTEQVLEIISEFSDAFALARTRWARLAEETHPDLRGAGIMVLQVVVRKGPVTVTGLSQLLDMDKAMVSRQVSKLRTLGFINTESAPEDGRVTLLTATEQALTTIEGLRARAAEDYHRRFAEWDDEALEQLRAGLHRYNAFTPERTSGPAVRCAKEHGGGATT
ncbi:DNA-binding MarR family transcriptional regulator [Leucobacter exalbidus]|uniref:DNA-binding MarR family transcriptional regulator n=1 Tax=Leucobacter exalbidus TaxID=662960 RepID=A0A940PMX5_9MICO|nr:MarR family transcriptional regulator [Leucobacter exalbidus]MBP1326108.1 DNA-binding MarR family transcriptional regulator [Leucobacter exalbidus]